MKTTLARTLQAFVLGILLFGTPSEPNAVLAGRRKPEIVQAKEITAEFLSSVKLIKKAYDFDHNGDDAVDMSVYLLKTENPDLKTKYVTIREAVNKKQLILRENPNLSNTRKEPPSSYSIFAQYLGGSPLYYSRGSQMRGGWQNRGFGRGGIMGRGSGYGDYGRRGYSGDYGRRSRYVPGTWSYNPSSGSNYNYDGFSGDGLKDSDLSGFGFEDTARSLQNTDSSEPVENPGFKVDALCFEKWRLIEESRRLGAPEYFAYAGMASPFVRRELALFPNQTRAHTAIEKELRRLGVRSKTRALADVFKDQHIKNIIDYYIANSKEVLVKNKGVSGMVVTGNSRILCVDIYSSPDLFKKMFSQLMQSAALGVCRTRHKSKVHPGRDDVEKFLSDIKQVQKLKKESSQNYRLCAPTLVGEAEIYSDQNGTKLVHLEAYPRSKAR